MFGRASEEPGWSPVRRVLLPGKGYVRSETVGVFFLQRVSEARRIYAKLVHVKANADGFTVEGERGTPGELWLGKKWPLLHVGRVLGQYPPENDLPLKRHHIQKAPYILHQRCLPACLNAGSATLALGRHQCGRTCRFASLRLSVLAA